MWAADLLAAEAAEGGNDSLLVVMASSLAAMLGSLVIVIKALIDGKTALSVAEAQQQKAEKPPESVPSLTHSGGSVDLIKLAGEVRVLTTWRSETREADELHDRTLYRMVDDMADLEEVVDMLVRWHDRNSPGWREP